MKKWFALFLSVFMVFSLAACSGSSTTSNSGSSSSDSGDSKVEEVKLRIAWWGSEPRHEYTLKLIELYEEKNPGVKIQAEYASWDDYWKKLAPQASAQQLPDLIQMDLSYLSQYAENGQLADLTPYVGKELDVTNFADNYVSGGKINDKLYAFNAGVNTLGFHYDAELLKKIGIDSLKEDWTWDDYKEVAKKAKDAGIFVDTGMKADVFLNYYLRTQGKSLFSKDGTALGYEDDQLFIDFFGMASQIVKDGAGPTPDYLAQLKGLEDNPVVKEKAIGVWQWSNQFLGLQQVVNRPMEIHNMVGPNISDGLFLKPSMFWGVANNSKHKEEAAKFISFFVNDIDANKIIMGERGIPGSSAVKEALKPLLTPEQVQVFESVEWAEQNSSPFNGPDPIGAGEIIETLDSLSERMNYGQLSVEDAAKQFRQQAESILSQNK